MLEAPSRGFDRRCPFNVRKVLEPGELPEDFAQAVARIDYAVRVHEDQCGARPSRRGSPACPSQASDRITMARCTSARRWITSNGQYDDAKYGSPS